MPLAPDLIFFVAFTVTILVTRLFLYFRPVPSPTVFGLRLHHWMYGLVLTLVAFWISSIVLYSIGVGLFVDELTYLLTGGKTHEHNYSTRSLVGTAVFIVIIFLLRHYLVAVFP